MITALYPRKEQPLDDADLLSLYAYPPRSGPCARFNFVATADGAVNHQGVSGGLGGTADHRVFNLLRLLADAVVVGAGTIRAEGYAGELVDARGQQWRLDHSSPAHPNLVIISGSLDLDAGSALFTDSPVRPVVLTIEAAPMDRRRTLSAVADVVVAGHDSLDVDAALAELSSRGLTRLLCEGGPGVFGTFQSAGRVDELCLTVSPLLAGGTAPRIAAGGEHELEKFTLGHVLVSGDELLLRYVREDHRSGGTTETSVCRSATAAASNSSDGQATLKTIAVPVAAKSRMDTELACEVFVAGCL